MGCRHEYDWAAKQLQQVTSNREAFTIAIFDKLAALDPSHYYENLYKDKIDNQLSSLIDKL